MMYLRSAQWRDCLWVGWTLSSLPVVGCGGTTNVNAKDYDQSCSMDADCVVIQEGDICCGCPNAAINKNALSAYKDDLGECDAVCTIGCPDTLEAFCNAGTCDKRQAESAVCTPGELIFCSCEGGAEGTKECNVDGTGYGDCVCN